MAGLVLMKKMRPSMMLLVVIFFCSLGNFGILPNGPGFGCEAKAQRSFGSDAIDVIEGKRDLNIRLSDGDLEVSAGFTNEEKIAIVAGAVLVGLMTTCCCLCLCCKVCLGSQRSNSAYE